MLSRARRASTTLTSGLGSGGGGGGGGFSTITSVEARAVSPRVAVQVALTETEPGDTPVVLSVAELPLPERVPLPVVQLATETATLSGLVQLADKFTVPPACRLVGLAEIDMVGGFFGGGGFTMKFAEQVASLFFFSLASVTRTVTV